MAYELDQTPRPKALGPHAIAATRREGRGASTREEPRHRRGKIKGRRPQTTAALSLLAAAAARASSRRRAASALRRRSTFAGSGGGPWPHT